MAEVMWMESALSDLDEIAEHIAFDNPDAADRVVQRIFDHADHLEKHPRIGSVVEEIGDPRYRQLVEPPCRILYRIEGNFVYIMHVLRFERLLRVSRLQDIDE